MAIKRVVDTKSSKAHIRQLKLFNLLAYSTSPVTTDEIITEPGLYDSIENLESRKKQYRRDREALKNQGISIVEVVHTGQQQNVASEWKLMWDDSHINLDTISHDDLSLLIDGLDILIKDQPSVYTSSLLLIEQTLRSALGMKKIYQEELQDYDEHIVLLNRIYTCINLAHTATFDYIYPDKPKQKKTVDIYGAYNVENTTYIVGYKHGETHSPIRTFNTDRISRFVDTQKPFTYPKPADFDIHNYVQLPFTIPGYATTQPFSATFVFTSAADEKVLEITRGLGEIEEITADGKRQFLWTLDKVYNPQGAARYCLLHSNWGLIPLAPQQLTCEYNQLLETIDRTYSADANPTTEKEA